MKPQNIIIAIAFLLVVSVFSFSFENITGNPILENQPRVSIVNDNVRAGQPIQIKVKINNYCIDPRFEFYSERGLRKDTRTFHPNEDDCAGQNTRTCKGNKYCKGDLKDDEFTMTYYTLPSWKTSPGIYNVRVKYIEKPGQSRYKTPFIERRFRVNP
jgi:hypothetical protein